VLDAKRFLVLTREENELLCRVGGETPMGRMVRRYWIPAIMSDELERDGAPKRVRLLGEDLVAFRSSDGSVGLLDEFCPHRGASLALARNENCALQCVYHGWRMDVSGRVLETPAEPEESTFAERMHALAYPVREAGGLVWAYLGPPGSEPPFPDFEWTSIPDAHRLIFKAQTDCNWVQAMEGALDSSHTPILHGNAIVPGAVSQTTYRSDQQIDRPTNDKRPRLEVEVTPYGFRYAAIRKPLVDPETTKYVRVTLFVSPVFVTFPAPAGFVYMQIFVPIDDEHTMFYFVQCRYDAPFDRDIEERRRFRAGMRLGLDLDENFRRAQRRENNWLQDRDAMRRPDGSFSGIFGVQAQDMAIQESMGAIYDRRREHLGASDAALIRMRRLMIDSVRAFAERGEAPLGLAQPVAYGRLRSEEKLIPIDEPWQAVGAFAGEYASAPG
jgi:phthalate 4,5-dioxygenase oxygenase subunit